MKIGYENLEARMQKMHKDHTMREMRITPDGFLRVSNGTELIVGKYIIYLNGVLYMRDGFRRYPEDANRSEDIYVYTRTATKLMLPGTDNMFEYISPKKEASEDTRFLLYAAHVRGVELILVDGSSSVEWLLRNEQNTDENLNFYEELASIILDKFDPKAAEVCNEFFKEEV